MKDKSRQAIMDLNEKGTEKKKQGIEPIGY